MTDPTDLKIQVSLKGFGPLEQKEGWDLVAAKEKRERETQGKPFPPLWM